MLRYGSGVVSGSAGLSKSKFQHHKSQGVSHRLGRAKAGKPGPAQPSPAKLSPAQPSPAQPSPANALSVGHHNHKATEKNRPSQIWSTTLKPKKRKENVHLGHTSIGNETYFFELRHHFDIKATAANRLPYYWGTTWKPKQQQQSVHLSIGAPLRDGTNGKQSYIKALGHHFEKATASHRHRTSQHWGTTSKPK